jgi:hypothetical protein
MIDPQYVNVSSLYSMAAMISALMIINVDPRERGDGISQRWRQAAAPALFYAGAIALKPTSIVFLGLQFGMAGTASFWTTGDWRTSISNAGRIATWSVVFLTPWLLLYAPYYSLAFTHPIGVPLTPVPEVVEPLSLVSLLSPAGTFYGASRLSYTCLATGLFLCALHATLRLRSDPATRKSHMGLASASAAAAATYLFWTLFGPRMQESVNTVRYSIPVLIGAASAALPLWAAITARRNVAVCTTMAVFLLLLFSSSMHQRLGTLLHQRSELAYLHKWRPAALNRNREFQERVLDGALTAEVQRLQEEIPPGRTILAWTGTPFLLDYGRNHVIDMNVAGLDQPWGRIPSVRYVTWQESGYGTHTEEVLNYEIAVFGRRTGKLDARALDVLHWLQEVVPASKIIDDMDGVLVIETDEKTLQPPN